MREPVSARRWWPVAALKWDVRNVILRSQTEREPMDFNDSPEEAAFRAEVRAWLGSHARRLGPHEPRRGGVTAMLSSETAESDAAMVDAARAWQRTLADAGWTGLTWPKQYGGRDLTPIQLVIWSEELADHDTPPDIFGIGLGMIGPTIIAHGTEEQKQRYLAADAVRRGDLVPALERAERRLRHRVAADTRGARRRRLGHQRPEGLDVGRALRAHGLDHRADRSRRTEASRHHVLHRAHVRPGHRRPAAAADDGRVELQRGVPERRPRARLGPRSATSTTAGVSR